MELVGCRLADLYHGSWEIIQILDDDFQKEPSPEVMVSNGTASAAVEVKRLAGDSSFQRYLVSQVSLERYLAPSCGGYYTLSPSIDFRLPIDLGLRRHLRREIERVAPSLAVGDTGFVRITRVAHVSMALDSGPGYLFCCHNATGGVVAEVSPRLTGSFFLVDDRQWEHSFVTEAGRAAFHDALVAACESRRAGGPGHLSWTEEWELFRADDEKPAGVYVLCVTEAREVRASVLEVVDAMLEKARKNFERTRWADHHVLVLDRVGALTDADRVTQVMDELEEGDFGPIDVVVFVDGDNLIQIWPRQTESTPGNRLD